MVLICILSYLKKVLKNIKFGDQNYADTRVTSPMREEITAFSSSFTRNTTTELKTQTFLSKLVLNRFMTDYQLKERFNTYLADSVYGERFIVPCVSCWFDLQFRIEVDIPTVWY